tara:strand:+ start:98 stop:547 length:450 start_codon:yes stop_codon:yes gene_type:complete
MTSGVKFGFINGIIDMLALLVGLFATKVSKVGMIGAIVAMMISNPINDSYSLYISSENEGKSEARQKATHALIMQILTHASFLLIIILSTTTTLAIKISIIYSLIVILAFDKYFNIAVLETIKKIGIILILISITYFADAKVYQYFPDK